MKESQDHTLEYLLGFDGRLHWLQDGHYLKFVIARVKPTATRPHGLRYSFTLHDPDGKRLVGFDNAHPVMRARKGRPASDHWHRTERDEGRPYKFVDADKLLADFFKEVHRVLEERGISDEVVRVTTKRRKK
jgi:hypothetical protein